MPAFVPERLSVALDVRAMSAAELARAIGVTPQTATDYRRGRASPSDFTLSRISQALQFPRAFFERPMVKPPLSDEEAHLRARSRIRAGDWKRVRALGGLHVELVEQLVAMVGAHRMRATQIPSATDLDEVEGLTYQPEVSGPRSAATIEAAATMVRRRWGLGDGFLPNVVRLLEAKGVWVQVLPAAEQEIDAFSYWMDGRAIIVLNHAKRDPFRSRFDAAHELGHLVLHETSGHRAHEQEANAFASAFLMPAQTFVPSAPGTTNPRDYLPLKAVWGASVAAMLYRSRTLDLLDAGQFESAMVRYSMLGWRQGEPAPTPREHEMPVLLDHAIDIIQARSLNLAAGLDELALADDVLLTLMGAERLARVRGRSVRSTSAPARGEVLEFPRRAV